MLIRLFAAMLLVSVAGIAWSQEATDAPTVAVGDTVLLNLVDAPAIAYLTARSVSVPEGVADVPGAIGVPLESTVTVATEGKLEVQYLTLIDYGTDRPKVFTVTATSRMSNLKKQIGAHTWSPPSETVPAAIQRIKKRHSTLPLLRIDTIDAVKLQYWVPEQK